LDPEIDLQVAIEAVQVFRCDSTNSEIYVIDSDLRADRVLFSAELAFPYAVTDYCTITRWYCQGSSQVWRDSGDRQCLRVAIDHSVAWFDSHRVYPFKYSLAVFEPLIFVS
jgi:hypothetical protein